jgi:glycerol uptake facilitator-like aquaporin
VDALFGGLRARVAAGYIAVQVGGAGAGVIGANLLFGLPAVTLATTERTGAGLAASEAVATFGLLVIIFGTIRSGRTGAVPLAVGAWIAAAIFFTSSTSFANPAVTVARMLSDTFAGIAPAGAPAFLAAQLVGALVAAAAIRWLFAPGPSEAAAVVVPRTETGVEP